MLDKTKIFNIPANYYFLESVIGWLLKNFSNQIPEVKVFLPNRRSCNELKNLFLKHNITLPKIKAISDISIEDFSDLVDIVKVKEEINENSELLRLAPISSLAQIFLIAEEVVNGFSDQKFGFLKEFDQLLKTAISLKELFDEIEMEEVDLEKIVDIDVSNLALHRQFNLDFLRKFHVYIKNLLLKRGLVSEVTYQKLLANNLASMLSRYGSIKPILIAGSTGSIPSSRNLIKAVSRLPNGNVLLSGLDLKELEVASLPENHPQFSLYQLLNFVGILPHQVENFTKDDYKMSDDSRQKILSLMMMPSQQTAKWQQYNSNIKEPELTDFTVIKAANEVKEAQIIRVILLKNLAVGKKAALITNNHRLADLVKLELSACQVGFNDSRKQSLIELNLIQFLLLILDLFDSNFNSHSLLALLKHPLCYHAQSQKILADFEVQILRQRRSGSGYSAILQKIQQLNLPNESVSTEETLLEFFSQFYQELQPCYFLLQGNDKELKISLEKLSQGLIQCTELLTKKTWKELLEQEPAETEITNIFQKLLSSKEVYLERENVVNAFKIVLSQAGYFQEFKQEAKIQILSTIEARLLNYELVIVGSLNEGDFPQIESESWLGKKVRKELGVDYVMRKIGQNASDFWHYCSNKSVVLTRSLSNNGAPTIESPFLLRLRILYQKMGLKLQESFDIEASTKLTKEGTAIKKAGKVPKEHYPQKFSITEISKLISDPYSIYAKKILQLKVLEKIDVESSYAEFGSFVHKVLEEFVKNPQQENFLLKAAEIFTGYFPTDEAKLIWWPKFEKIIADFVIENEHLIQRKNYVELPVRLEVSGVEIVGKIDRICVDNQGHAEIFDYKTGRVSTTKDVEMGIDPQLTIAALALVEGLIEKKIKFLASEITTLNYWKLSSSNANKITQVAKNNQEVQILIASAKQGLTKLLEYFSDTENGYVVTDKTAESDYWHLARTEKI